MIRLLLDNYTDQEREELRKLLQKNYTRVMRRCHRRCDECPRRMVCRDLYNALRFLEGRK